MKAFEPALRQDRPVSSVTRKDVPGTVKKLSLDSLCFAMTLLWAGLSPLTGLRLGSAGTAADAVLLVTFLLNLVLVLVPRIDRYQRVVPVLLGIVLLGALVTIATLPVTSDLRGAVQATETMFIALVAIVVLLYIAALRPGGLLRVMDAYTAGAVVLSASAWVLPSAANGRAAGLAGNPVEIGGATAAALAYLVFRRPRGNRGQVLKWVCAAVLASSFLAAQTVTGPLAVAVALATVFAVALPFRLGRTVAAVIGVVIAFWVFLWFPVGQQLWEKLASSNITQGFATGVDFASQTTFQSRLTLIALGIERIEARPWFGYGLADSDTIVFAGLQPHNVIVLAWVAGGLPLMLAFVGLLVATIVGVVRLRRSPDPARVALAAGAIAAWVGALSGPVLYQRPVLLILLLFVTSVVVRTPDAPAARSGLRARAEGSRLKGRTVRAG